jgi:uncharacterized repeat protein (TIGR01451 family)
VSNIATITPVAGTTELNATNNSATDTDTVLDAVDLSITKTGTLVANQGSVVSYVIRVTNNSSTVNATGAVISDTLPAGLGQAYWNCVVPIDGVFATTANIGTRTDEVCVTPAASSTALKQTSTTIEQTVNLPAGRSVEIRVIGRATGGSLSNTASVAAPSGVIDPNLANNTSAAATTTVQSALTTTSCTAVKYLDANGVSNSDVSWPVKQGGTLANVNFNRSGSFNINQANSSGLANASGTAPHPLRMGQGTDRFTKTSGTTWSWTVNFSQPIPLNELVLHINDVNAYDPTLTLSMSGGTATLSDWSGYSAQAVSNSVHELVFNQTTGQIQRPFNRNVGNEAASANPRASMLLLSNSSSTVSSVTLSSSNTATGDLIAIELGARVNCDYGDAAATFGDPFAGVLANYLQMGASVPDTEGSASSPRNTTGDDVTSSDDEDLIATTAQLSAANSTFSLTGLSVLNQTGSAATLRGWADVNQDGVIDSGELATVAVPSAVGMQTVDLNWVGLSNIAAGQALLRFTLLNDADQLFGEVEDHLLQINLIPITGRVFVDNSGSTGITANAYNSTQETGEVGLSAVVVQLTDCAGGVLASTKTNAAGDYQFNVLQSTLSAPNFCVVEQNGTGYTSVSGTTGYSRGTDAITITKAVAASYDGHNFGDARLGLVLTSDGQQTTTPAGTVSYAHTLTAESVLTPTLATTTTQQPNNATDQGWTTILYLDNNCNGQVDGSEAPVGTLSPLLPNQSVCVVQRVNAPASASNGAQHVASLSASYVATVQGGEVLSGSSQSRTDTTLVGTAGLDMTKQVRVVSSCPSNDSSSTGFTARNTAKNGDFLEYEIIYKNRSARNLSTVVVRDAVPSHALFKSALCMSTPSGAACAVGSTPAVNATGTLSWSITGPVAPNAQGSVRFCVQVPALAEGPQ